MRLFAGLILSQPTASQLYFYAREHDVKGSGWCRLSLKLTAKYFQKSVSTILRWARNCFYFHDAEVRKDTLYLKYKSIYKVKKSSKTPSHASFMADSSILKDINSLKSLCYEAAIARQQESCYYIVMKLKGSSKQIFLPSLEKIQSSKNAKGCEYFDKEDMKAFVKRHIVPIGASQSTVSKKVGRSTTTLRKYVSHLAKVNIWWRTYNRSKSEETPEYYYKTTVFKKRKDGTIRKEGRLYRRMPNYYFCNVYTKREETKDVFVVADPCAAIDEKKKLIMSIVAQMPKKRGKRSFKADLTKPQAQSNFIEKLWELPAERIVSLVAGTYMFAAGLPDDKQVKEQVLEKMSSISIADLMDLFEKTLKLIKPEVDDRLQDYIKLLYRRASKSPWVIPPLWETHRTTGYVLQH